MNKITTAFASLLIGTATCTAQTQVLNEDFQGGMPATWTIQVNDGFTLSPTVSEFSPGWIAIADPDNTSDTVAASSSYFTTSGAANRWLISPPIALGSFGNYIKWRSKSYDPSYPDSYRVFVSTTDNQLSSFTDTLGIVQFELDEWTDYEVNLSEEGFDGQTIYVAFVLVTNGGFKLFIDDVNVRKDDPLAVNELETEHITVYPNPTADQVFFSSNSIAEVKLLDFSGKLLHTQHDSTPLSLQNYTAGMYFIQVTGNDKHTTTIRIQKR